MSNTSHTVYDILQSRFTKLNEFIKWKFTLNVGRHPTGLAKLAWNVLKLTNIYAAKKKFEISGAIAFNSPIKINLKFYVYTNNTSNSL